MTSALGNLPQVAEAPHEVLVEFIHNCSPDPHVRTMTVTAFVLACGQAAGRGVAERLPSPILVHARESGSDPIQTFIDELFSTPSDDEPEREDPEALFRGNSKQASRVMTKAIAEQKKLDAASHDFGPPPASWDRNYHEARVAGFGPGHLSRYEKAWHPQIGLITDMRNAITLRLDSPQDKAAFRRDVLKNPSKLLQAIGPGKGLHTVRKMVAISGSLSPAECDETLVDAILGLGLPFFFLPHLAETPPQAPNPASLGVFSVLLERNALIPMKVNPVMLNNHWCRTYQSWLWKRLQKLPAPYRFPVMEAVHQLDGICEHIARFAGNFHNARDEEVAELMFALYPPTLRGITLGIAGLAWHGHGVDTGLPLPKLRELLHTLRANGPTTRRDIQRAAGFKTAAERDEVLAQLAGEGLVFVDGNTVSAATLVEFVEGLHNRPELPPAPYTRADTSTAAKS